MIFNVALVSDSEDSRKKIYFDKNTMEIGKGVSEEIVGRIVSEISETIVQKYRGEFQYIDESVYQNLYKKLKSQQLMGCSTEACMKMIEDNIDIDMKITGKIRKKGTSYTLLLKKLDLRKNGEVLKQQDYVFSEDKLEYYTRELTLAVMEKDYVIRHPNDPNNLLFSSYFWKSAFLPGSGQIALGRNEGRGEIFQILSFGVLGFTGIQYFLAQGKANAYQSINPFPVYALTASGNGELAYLYSDSIYSDKRKEYQSSVSLFNAGLLVYTLLWSANLIDLVWFSQNEKVSFPSKSNLEFNQKSIVYSPVEGQKFIETFTYLQYSIYF